MAERDDLVEGEDEIEGGAADALLVGLLLRVLGEDLAEESQDVEVLEDVGRLVGDEEEVQLSLLHGGVHVPDVLGLDVRVLGARADELGERGEQALDANARHRDVLARHQGCGRMGGEEATRSARVRK